MKKINLLYTSILFLSITLFSVKETQAQCDTIATICNQNFTKEYLSDGQEYRALLINEQTAEFHLTLYGGSIYRFGACSGMNSGNLVFRVYDQDYNEIFSNSEHELSPYWDFKVNSTLDVIVEANLNQDKVNSGCAVLLVGFKP